METHDVTSFASNDFREFLPGIGSWEASINGFYESNAGVSSTTIERQFEDILGVSQTEGIAALSIYEIRNADLLYHEATFLHDMQERARDTFHSTALQAATIATKANVAKLIIGHFSSRYKELLTHLDEARRLFQNTELATEGSKFKIEVKKKE